MKVIRIGGGIFIIIISLFISFGIIVSCLKENDKDLFKYLILPVLMVSFGIYLIVKREKIHNS